MLPVGVQSVQTLELGVVALPPDPYALPNAVPVFAPALPP
jgi:hypothetical protein